MMESMQDDFTCGLCQVKFSNLCAFLLHKVHHVEAGKPGGCPLCGLSFSRQVTLREHLLRKHAILDMKPTNVSGKRRGRPRKDMSDTIKVSTEVTSSKNENEASSVSVSDSLGEYVTEVTGSSDLTAVTNIENVREGQTLDGEVVNEESESLPLGLATDIASTSAAASQQTMHIIIDRVGEEDLNSSGLSSAVLQSGTPGCPIVKYSSPPAATSFCPVVVESSTSFSSGELSISNQHNVLADSASLNQFETSNSVIRHENDVPNSVSLEGHVISVIEPGQTLSELSSLEQASVISDFQQAQSSHAHTQLTSNIHESESEIASTGRSNLTGVSTLECDPCSHSQSGQIDGSIVEKVSIAQPDLTNELGLQSQLSSLDFLDTGSDLTNSKAEEHWPASSPTVSVAMDITVATSAKDASSIVGTSLVAHSSGKDRRRSVRAKDDEEQDFLFVLVESPVKGKTVQYNRQSFRCFHCHYSTSIRRSLVKHMGDNHLEQLAVHQCISVVKVENSHPQNQQVLKMSDYVAMVSRQRKQTGRQRIRAVERQDLPGTFPCNKCDKVFGRLRYLRKHQAVHGTDQKHLCNDCGKAFKTKAYLSAHRQTHTTKVYQCKECDFSSSINSLIHTHRQQHNGSSIICDICGLAYNDRPTLKKHQQVHDKSRPFACTYLGCTWRFKTEMMCRAHYRSHTTTGRFGCQVCGYVFRHKHHLQRHLAKIHAMDDATIYRATCGNKHTVQVPNSGDVVEETVIDDNQGKQLVEVVHEESQPLTDTVRFIVNSVSGLSSEQLQSVLESRQFIIATEDDDMTGGNYEVTNITMTYDDTLVQGHVPVSEGETILIPHDAECSQIIFHQEAVVPASVT